MQGLGIVRMLMLAPCKVLLEMYERLPHSEDDVVGFEVRGEITEAELEEMLTELESVIAEHGSVNLLVYMPSIPRPELDALDEDLGFWLRHGEDIDRYAVVGESDLLEWVTKAGDRVSSPTCKYFATDERAAAWNWLKHD